MIVTRKTFQEDEDGSFRHFFSGNENCYHCGKSTLESLFNDQPIVFWHGCGGVSIAFHQECANHFLLGFARDCHEMKQITKKQG